MDTRLKGNALFFALLISTVIALICTGLLSLYLYQRLLYQQIHLQSQLLANVESALVVATQSNTIVDYQTDLYGGGNDSISIQRFEWGLYDVVSATAFKHTAAGLQQQQKSYLIGSLPNSLLNSALYLAGQQQECSMGGNTLIKGTIWTPSGQIKKLHLTGLSHGNNPIHVGKKKKSQTTLPISYQQRLQRWSEKNIQSADIVSYNNLADSITNPFHTKTLVIKGRDINIDNQYLSGNIFLQADSSITIYKGAVLQDIILQAPRIFFAGDFTGNVQAFATKQIYVGENCNFNYPSVLGGYASDKSTEQVNIDFGLKANIIGVIALAGTTKQMPIIVVGKETTITGQVYTTGLVNAGGTITGNLSCQGLLANAATGDYKNCLLDTKLLADDLSPHFVFPIYANSSPTQKVKLLY